MWALDSAASTHLVNEQNERAIVQRNTSAAVDLQTANGEIQVTTGATVELPCLQLRQNALRLANTPNRASIGVVVGDGEHEFKWKKGDCDIVTPARRNQQLDVINKIPHLRDPNEHVVAAASAAPTVLPTTATSPFDQAVALLSHLSVNGVDTLMREFSAHFVKFKAAQSAEQVLVNRGTGQFVSQNPTASSSNQAPPGYSAAVAPDALMEEDEEPYEPQSPSEVVQPSQASFAGTSGNGCHRDDRDSSRGTRHT